jgi:phosphate-selective porin OprO/OprP
MSSESIDKKILAFVLVMLAVLAPPLRAEDAKQTGPTAAAGAEGFSLQSESGEYRLQLRGYVQFDGRFFSGDEGALAVDTFVLRRVRPILQGTLGRQFEFSVMPDFGGGVTVLQDAWLDFKPSPKLRVRVGKFKSPVGLERLQSATATSFVERAFPTQIVPNRDVGLQVHGVIGDGVLSYAVALVDGAPDGGSVDTDLNDGKDRCPRIVPGDRSASSPSSPGSPRTGRARATLRSFRTTAAPWECSPSTPRPPRE